MLDYATLKIVHVSCVAVSGCSFVLRGALAFAGSPLLARRWVRVLPHVIDTALLASAIAMVLIARLWPAAHPWLAAKIALLLLYVLLGSIALRRARSLRGRAIAFAGALVVFALIIAVALTRGHGFVAQHSALHAHAVDSTQSRLSTVAINFAFVRDARHRLLQPLRLCRTDS